MPQGTYSVLSGLYFFKKLEAKVDNLYGLSFRTLPEISVESESRLQGYEQ